MRKILKLLLAGIISLFLLSIFAFVYKYTPGRIITPDSATDYKWKEYGYMNNMEEGFSWLRIDSNGYNNHRFIEDEPIDILIIGSSHTEGVQVSQDSNYSARLGKMINNENIYNIGISGHTFCTCISNLKSAVDQYHPRDYVIIETTSVDFSLDDLQKVIDNSYPEIYSVSGIVAKIGMYFPAIKLIGIQCQKWLKEGEESFENKEMNRNDLTYTRALSQLLMTAKKTVPADCQLVIFYNAPTTIDSNGFFVIDENQDSIETFLQVCKENDIIFIDMTNAFVELYEREHVLAHGFINTAVGIGHLNEFCHQAIAEKLAEVIWENNK